MTLRVNVTIYWSRGQTITANGGTMNPIEQSRRRVVQGTGWQRVTPEGALKDFLDRLKIKKLFVPHDTWTNLGFALRNNNEFTNKINLLPQIRILSRKEIEDLL